MSLFFLTFRIFQGSIASRLHGARYGGEQNIWDLHGVGGHDDKLFESLGGGDSSELIITIIIMLHYDGILAREGCVCV